MNRPVKFQLLVFGSFEVINNLRCKETVEHFTEIHAILLLQQFKICVYKFDQRVVNPVIWARYHSEQMEYVSISITFRKMYITDG